MNLKEIAEDHGLTPEGVDYALTQYQLVICEITHGMLSKLSYDAKDIIRTAQERWCDTCELKEQEAVATDTNVPGKWISVKDRLPENQDPVIVFVPPHVDEAKGTFLGYVGMAYHTSLGEGFWCGTDGNLYGAIGMIYPPTHWMPLPEPPKEVGGGADGIGGTE